MFINVEHAIVLDGGAPDHLGDDLVTAAVLRSAGTTYQVDLMSRPSMGLAETLSVVRRSPGRPLLVIGPRVSGRTADAYRRAGINYVDAAGNAHIRFDGLLIDVRGRRNAGDSAGTVRRPAKGPANLFSAKRAQVVFALLAWPQLVDAPLRQLSSVSGASLGQVSETLKLLGQHGYRETLGSTALRRREELLDGWFWTYPTGLAQATRLREFTGSGPSSASAPLTTRGRARSQM